MSRCCSRPWMRAGTRPSKPASTTSGSPSRRPDRGRRSRPGWLRGGVVPAARTGYDDRQHDRRRSRSDDTRPDTRPTQGRTGPEEEPNAEDPYHVAGDRRRGNQPDGRQCRRQRPEPRGIDARRRPSALKIGVVTDVGTLDDKNFNEYTFKGASDGASRSRGRARRSRSCPRTRPNTRPTSSSSSTRGYDVIVTHGLQPGQRHAQAAHDNPDVMVRRHRPVAHLRGRAGQRGCRTSNARGRGDAAAQLHRHRLPGRPGRIPRGHRGSVPVQDGQGRCHRWHERLCAVHPLHPGLRARRQVGEPGHRGQ